MKIKINIFLLFIFFININKSLWGNKNQLYNMNEIINKVENNKLITSSEMQCYGFYMMAHQGKTHAFANIFWILFHIGNLVLTNSLSYLKPFAENIILKYKFKNKFEKLNIKEYKLSNIIGYENNKIIYQNIIDYLRQQKETKKYKKNEGIIFYGPPGCGKTAIVKIISAEANIPIITIMAKDLVNDNGFIQNNLDTLFDTIKQKIKKEGPCILFFDEFDFLVNTRNNNMSQEDKISIQNFLHKLEEDIKGLQIIACTNKKENIDEALLRPGRLGNHIEVPLPSLEDIKYFYNSYFKKEQNNINKDEFIASCVGMNVTEIIKKFE